MPPELKQLLIFALINPGTIVAGLLIGKAADQVQKIVVGAFAGGVAGLVVAWLAHFAGVPVGMQQPRNVAGLFVIGWVLGGFWSWIGYRFLRRGR